MKTIRLYFKGLNHLEAESINELMDFYNGTIRNLNYSCYMVKIETGDEYSDQITKRFYVDSSFHSCIGFMESLKEDSEVWVSGFEDVNDLIYFLQSYYEHEVIIHEETDKYKDKLWRKFLNMIRDDDQADPEMIDFFIDELEHIKKIKSNENKL